MQISSYTLLEFRKITAYFKENSDIFLIKQLKKINECSPWSDLAQPD
jgi:hypothetical protein